MESYGLVPWLRGAVTERMEAARQACPRTDGQWWRRESDLGDGGPPEPDGHLYAGERITDEDGSTWGGEYIVAYDEGAPSDSQFEHMERNDPRDVIARCEFELALLDEHAVIRMPCTDARGVPGHFCECATCGFGGPERSYPCKTVRLLGRAYRFRDGYRQEWKP